MAGLAGALTLSLLIQVRDGASVGGIGMLLAFSGLIALYGVAASVLFGLPLHALLVRLCRTGIRAYAVAGLAAGALTGALMSSSSDYAVFGAALVAGITGATAFWTVVRPDRTRTVQA